MPLLREVVTAKPDLGEARYLLGKVLLAQGRAEEARGHLEEAARLDPEAADVAYQLGKAYHELGRAEVHVEPGGAMVWQVSPQNPFAVFGGLGT